MVQTGTHTCILNTQLYNALREGLVNIWHVTVELRWEHSFMVNSLRKVKMHCSWKDGWFLYNSERKEIFYNVSDKVARQTIMRDGFRRAADAMTSVVATSYLTWPPAIHKNIVTQVCRLGLQNQKLTRYLELAVQRMRPLPSSIQGKHQNRPHPWSICIMGCILDQA